MLSGAVLLLVVEVVDREGKAEAAGAPWEATWAKDEDEVRPQMDCCGVVLVVVVVFADKDGKGGSCS